MHQSDDRWKKGIKKNGNGWNGLFDKSLSDILASPLKKLVLRERANVDESINEIVEQLNN